MSVNYKKQMLALMSGQIISLGLGFLLPLILVRVLSVDDYGYYAQFNVILSFSTVFFSFGISSELYYFYPKEERNIRAIIVFQSLMLLFVFALFALALFYIPTVRKLIIANDFLEKNFYYLLFSIFFSIPTVLIMALYVVNHDNKTSALFLPISTILRVALILIFYLVYRNIDAVFLAIFISTVLQFIFVIVYTSREIFKNKEKYDPVIDFGILKQQLAYTIPLGFSSSLRVLAQQLDKLIVLTFITPAAYAIYSIAFYGVPGLNQVYLSISQVYIPRMSKAFKDDDIDLTVKLYNSMVSKTLSYTIPVLFIICLYADRIIPFVFSEKYAESVIYFQIYLITFLFTALGNGNILRATGNTSKTLWAYFYSTIVIIPTTYFLIKYYQLNGAIWSAVAGNLIPRLLLTSYDMKALDITIKEILPWKDILKILLIALISLIPFVYINLKYEFNLFYVLVMIGAYLILTFFIQILNDIFVLSRHTVVEYLCEIKTFIKNPIRKLKNKI